MKLSQKKREKRTIKATNGEGNGHTTMYEGLPVPRQEVVSRESDYHVTRPIRTYSQVTFGEYVLQRYKPNKFYQ